MKLLINALIKYISGLVMVGLLLFPAAGRRLSVRQLTAAD